MRPCSAAIVRIALSAAWGLGCGGDEASPAASTTAADASDATAVTVADGSSAGTDADASGDDGLNAQCSVWDQDCPAGTKCVPWSDRPDLVPDDIRCCPEVAAPAQIGDPCAVDGYFGSCIDNCAEGSFCLDIDDDGAGVCQAFCRGKPDDPVCELDEACLIYFGGLPLCFRKCDPLVQDCVGSEGCYPDEASAGNTGFICLPQIGAGHLGGDCWLLSSCDPGLLCVTPEYFPECGGTVGCCTPICALNEADDCNAIVPGTACVSWYVSGQSPPSPSLENVGACVIPP